MIIYHSIVGVGFASTNNEKDVSLPQEEETFSIFLIKIGATFYILEK